MSLRMMTVILLIATTWVWGLSPCSAAAPPRPGGSDTTDVRAEGFPRPVALGWTASMGAGLAQGDQVLRDGTHFMATASVAKAVRRSLAVGVVVSFMPATETGTGPTRFETTSRVWEFALSLRLTSDLGPGVAPYAEVAPALFHGSWQRQEFAADGASLERSVTELFPGIHVGLVFPFRLGPAWAVDLGARYLYTTGVNLAPLVGVSGGAEDGLRQFQLYGGLSYRIGGSSLPPTSP